jgi:hypothetical protein
MPGTRYANTVRRSLMLRVSEPCGHPVTRGVLPESANEGVSDAPRIPPVMRTSAAAVAATLEAQ